MGLNTRHVDCVPPVTIVPLPCGFVRAPGFFGVCVLLNLRGLQNLPAEGIGFAVTFAFLNFV